MFAAIAPHNLENVLNISSLDDALTWYMDLALAWQILIGAGTLGLMVGLFYMVFGFFFR
jgi:hypothetical protein